MSRRVFTWESTWARVLACLVVAVAAACSDGSSTTTNIAYSSYDGPGAGVTLQMAGIVVEMDPSVRYVSKFHSETGKPSVRMQTMNGMPFELVSGGFVLGGQSYDGLVDGDLVLITADGILVNGEKRWDLPSG